MQTVVVSGLGNRWEGRGSDREMGVEGDARARVWVVCETVRWTTTKPRQGALPHSSFAHHHYCQVHRHWQRRLEQRGFREERVIGGRIFLSIVAVAQQAHDVHLHLVRTPPRRRSGTLARRRRHFCFSVFESEAITPAVSSIGYWDNVRAACRQSIHYWWGAGEWAHSISTSPRLSASRPVRMVCSAA